MRKKQRRNGVKYEAETFQLSASADHLLFDDFNDSYRADFIRSVYKDV